VVDYDIKKQLVDGGMDGLLATHFAHLFIRDPIVIFAEDLKELDLTKSDHFENLQSTNWQHIRFKPPPSGSDGTGWRVEFRPMEIQITDFENAAFSIFIVLITRAILSFDLNFYVPIERVSENMETAHKRDAVLNEKFWFRKDPFPKKTAMKSSTNSPAPGAAGLGSRPVSRPPTPPLCPVEDEYELMSVDEVINGQRPGQGSGEFPGLIPLVENYLNSLNVDVETRCELAQYLELIRKRADGRLCTASKWMRDFVAKHPEYQKDSAVTDAIQYDLVKAVEQITRLEGKDGLGKEMLGRR
jgi:glutamate--cysteine ligase catalytic subunit